MSLTPRAQRLTELARRAGDLEFEAYINFDRPRAVHFMRKMMNLTRLAIQAQHGVKP